LDAMAILLALHGQTIKTATGQDNVILDVNSQRVLVGTKRSPHGKPVPVADVQNGLNILSANGSTEVTAAALGHRGSFVAAVLLTQRNVRLIGSAPAVLVMTSARTPERK
jgi:hypothetical protein